MTDNALREFLLARCRLYGRCDPLGWERLGTAELAAVARLCPVHEFADWLPAEEPPPPPPPPPEKPRTREEQVEAIKAEIAHREGWEFVPNT